MSEIDDVKSKINIIDVIGERVTLKKAGRNFKGLCPFHNEKTPSFMVSPDRQVFHCFGCAKGGSVIDFIMEYFHMDFPEALETLAARAGVTLTRRMGESPQEKIKEKIYEVNALASNYYEYLLTRHSLGEKALLYLKNRGISDKSIKTFSLGYSPNSWEGLYTFLKKKKYDDTILETAGLVIHGNHGYYDRFRGRVMFTLRDHRGNVVGFSGRLLDPTAKEAKYINTSETPVYIKSNILYALDVTKDAIVKANEAIVMEGEIDVISSFQAGVGNVVAIKGSALTENHVHLLKRFCERLTFCLDSDVAGDSAARRGIEIAEREGLDMRVVALPSGKDPDESVRENSVAFKKAVKEAVPIYDYFIASVKKRYDLATAYGKKKASEELLPTLKKISNAVVQAHYIKKTASLFDVSEDAIQTGIARTQSSVLYPSKKQEEKSVEDPMTRQEKIELYILALIIQGNMEKYLPQIEEIIPFDRIKHRAVARILLKCKEYMHSHSSFDLKHFSSSIPQELMPVLDEANLYDLSILLEDTERMDAEWQKAIKGLSRLIIKADIREVTDLMKGDNPEMPEETLQKLTAKLTKLDKE